MYCTRTTHYVIVLPGCFSRSTEVIRNTSMLAMEIFKSELHDWKAPNNIFIIV
jgi:hypothetical protein